MRDGGKIAASIIAATGIFLGMAYTKSPSNQNSEARLVYNPGIEKKADVVSLRKNNLDGIIRNVSNHNNHKIHDAVYKTSYTEVSENIRPEKVTGTPTKMIHIHHYNVCKPRQVVVYRPITCSSVGHPQVYHSYGCRSPWFPGKNIGKGAAWIFGWRPHRYGW